jgi:hypothetical protein
MEIQMGAVAKTYMRKGFLIYEEIGKYLFIYDFAAASFWISLYMRKILFSFLSVYFVYRPIRRTFTAGLCLFLLLLGTPMVTYGGIYIFQVPLF